MKVKFEKNIERCRDCPHFGIDGGPSPIMVCNHSKAPNQGYIISRPFDDSFPPLCPLKEEQ